MVGWTPSGAVVAMKVPPSSGTISSVSSELPIARVRALGIEPSALSADEAILFRTAAGHVQAPGSTCRASAAAARGSGAWA